MRHFAVEPAIEDLTRGFLNKEARWIEVAIEGAIKETENFLIDWTSYRECDKKKLKGLDR